MWRNWFIFSNDYLNGLQATFLRMASPPPDNPTLISELRDVSIEALERRCRVSGLCSRGNKETLTSRLLFLDAYLNGQSKAETSAAKDSGQLSAPPASERLGSLVGSSPRGDDKMAELRDDQKIGTSAGWMAVDEEAEKEGQPPGPMSKWILQETDDQQVSFIQFCLNCDLQGSFASGICTPYLVS